MKISKNLLIIPICLLFGLYAEAQTLEGEIVHLEGGKETPVVGAAIRWLGSGTGAISDLDGKFILPQTKEASTKKVVIQALGFNQDTFEVPAISYIKFTLKKVLNLEEVIITKEKDASMMLRSPTRQVEVLGKKELQKAACCNLSESFETNPTVDVSFADAVTGARQIRMLGLEGVYTQMMQENIPALRGLSSNYGLSFIPGTWIQGIQVSKGTGSVVNGFESLAGQINLEFIKPDDEDRLFLNLYGDLMGRGEANLQYSRQLNNKWGTNLLLHGNGTFRKNDMNHDHFLDVPLQKQFSFLNRYIYHSGKRLESQFGVGGTWQNRIGGQLHFDPKTDKGTTNAYGVGIDIKRFEAFGKLGIMFPDKPYKSIGNMASFTHHQQQSYFGLRTYNGEQNSFYLNSIYQTIIEHTGHTIKTGVSLQADDYKETFNDFLYERKEIVPGTFAEYTYTNPDKIGIVAGFRADYHNLYGLMLTPRLHTRFQLNPKTVLRAAGGRGYRTPNVWVENAAIWASSREIFYNDVIPQQEKAWNYGASLLRDIHINGREGYISADFYRTDFQSQLLADLDRNPYEVWLYNSTEKSFANSFQLEVSSFIAEGLQAKMAGKIYDVKATYNGILMAKPFVPQRRFLTTLSYETPNKKWNMDVTGLWFGKIRIPHKEAHEPMDNEHVHYAPHYWVFHTQLTRNFKRFSIYAGSENLLNYRQPNPILAAHSPFSREFDAAMIWGPVEGRRIYAGLRWGIINQKPLANDVH